MDMDRARKIIRSPQTFAVMHNGKPVWIERITNGDEVQINYLGTSERTRVTLGDLVEG